MAVTSNQTRVRIRVRLSPLWYNILASLGAPPISLEREYASYDSQHRWRVRGSNGDSQVLSHNECDDLIQNCVDQWNTSVIELDNSEPDVRRAIENWQYSRTTMSAMSTSAYGYGGSGGGQGGMSLRAGDIIPNYTPNYYPAPSLGDYQYRVGIDVGRMPEGSDPLISIKEVKIMKSKRQKTDENIKKLTAYRKAKNRRDKKDV